MHSNYYLTRIYYKYSFRMSTVMSTRTMDLS